MTQLQRLGGLVEETVKHIKDDGMDPTAALIRTASDHGMSPRDVDFVAGQVNRSGHLVHMVRSKGLARIADFPLADPVLVKQAMGKSTAVLAKEPEGESVLAAAVRKSVDGKTVLAKTGNQVRKSASPEPVIQQTLKEKLLVRRTAAAETGTLNQLGAAFAASIEAESAALKRDLADLGGRLRRQSSADVASFSRRVAGRYGDAGKRLLECVSHFAGVDIAVPHTATASAVFPAEPVYDQAARAIDASQRLANLHDNADIVKHCALQDSFMEDFLANVSALAVGSMMPGDSRLRAETMAGASRMEADKNAELAGKDLSLGTQAELAKLRTRDAFMQAVLNDPNLRGYPLRRLTRAFNDTVQNAPEILHRPAMLRAGMMNALSSTVPDIFTLKTMAEAGKSYREDRQATMRQAEQRKEQIKQKGKDFAQEAADLTKDTSAILQADAGEVLAARKARREAYAKAFGQLGEGLDPAQRATDLASVAKGLYAAGSALVPAQTRIQKAQHAVQDASTPSDVEPGERVSPKSSPPIVPNSPTAVAPPPASPSDQVMEYSMDPSVVRAYGRLNTDVFESYADALSRGERPSKADALQVAEEIGKMRNTALNLTMDRLDATGSDDLGKEVEQKAQTVLDASHTGLSVDDIKQIGLALAAQEVAPAAFANNPNLSSTAYGMDAEKLADDIVKHTGPNIGMLLEHYRAEAANELQSQLKRNPLLGWDV